MFKYQLHMVMEFFLDLIIFQIIIHWEFLILKIYLFTFEIECMRDRKIELDIPGTYLVIFVKIIFMIFFNADLDNIWK